MRFENKTLTEDVVLDYNQFVGCEFKNCKVIYNGGPFYLQNVRFNQVEYVLAGAANDTLQYLRFLKELSPTLVENFLRKRDEKTQPEAAQKLN